MIVDLGANFFTGIQGYIGSVFTDCLPLTVLFVGLFLGAFLIWQWSELAVAQREKEVLIKEENEWEAARQKSIDEERYQDTIFQVSDGKEGLKMTEGMGARHFDYWGNIFYIDSTGKRYYPIPPKLPKGLTAKN